MNAALLQCEDLDLEPQVAFRSHESPRSQRNMSSKSKWTTKARYRRRSANSTGSFAGAHRRRQKRNYL